MTPASVASFMASMFGSVPKHIRLLDAGAGVGALTAAFVQEVTSRVNTPQSIDVTAFEVDGVLANRLETTLIACASECARVGIVFTSRIIQDDFILHAAEPLISSHATSATYDCAILNPPYAKINVNSKWRKALSRLSIETSNLYTAFIAVALDQLKAGGQLVAITPRSFCNGSYFESFRRLILQSSALERIHVYESRRKAFQDDDVLQENIIFRLTRGRAQPNDLILSSNDGPSSLETIERRVPFCEVVLPEDQHSFIRLPTTNEQDVLAIQVRSLPATLKDLGLTVSTGRVVDFRAKEHVRKEPETGTVPLIYATHFNDGFILWPKPNGRKANALAFNAATSGLVVPRGTYVLTKRFTSKEERRRIVASIYDPSRIEADHIGFENHLNYFHKSGQGLPSNLARGLAVFLNSSAVDQFFRQFSGHTQVNATDLRNLRYPSSNQLTTLGSRVGNVMPDQAGIDHLVNTLL